MEFMSNPLPNRMFIHPAITNTHLLIATVPIQSTMEARIEGRSEL